MPHRCGHLALPLLFTLTAPLCAADGPRTDLYGDPLPPGAIARLGTVRLRHGGGILALAFSPDGKIVAAGDAESQVSLWSFTTGKEIRRLPKVENLIHTMVFSPDGKLLAFATLGGEIVYLYEPATGEEVRQLKLKSRWIHALAFSPDSKFLAWGTGDKAVHLWDVRTAKEVRQLKGFETDIGFLAFLPDGNSLLIGSTNRIHSSTGEIVQRDLRTGKDLHRFKVDRDGAGVAVETSAQLAALSPDGKRLLSVAPDHKLCLWELASEKEVWRLAQKDGRWMTLGFAPDGKSLAVATWDTDKRLGLVKLLDARTGRELRRLQGVNGATMRTVFSPDGKVLAVAGWDHCVRFFNPATGTELPRGGGHQERLDSVTFCVGGEQVATGAEDGTFRLWEPATGKEVRRLECGGRRCEVTCFPDGKRLLLWGDGAVRVWDAVAGKELHRIREPGRGCSAVGITAMGEALGLTFAPDRIQVWNLLAGEVRKEFNPGKDSGSWWGPTLSPDGRTLATYSMGADEGGCLWDLATGRVRHRIKQASGFAFSSDGKTVAIQDRAVGVLLWETATGKERGRLNGGPDILFQVAFAPDGRLLASGGSDGTIHLWDTVTGRELRRLSAHRGWVTALAFSPDGRRLVSAGYDTTALVWDVERLVPPAGPVKVLTAKEREALWSDLAGEDASGAYRAIHALRSAGPSIVPWLRRRLPADKAPPERARISKLITDLDSDQFAVREAATQALERLGAWAEPQLRERLKGHPSLECRRRVQALLQRLEDQRVGEPKAEALQALRAVEVLEHLDSAEARRLLEALAKGGADVRLAREAKASLGRMSQRDRTAGRGEIDKSNHK